MTRDHSLENFSPIGAKSTPAFLWYNGNLIEWEDALVHVNSVGHASVSSVFEGIRAYKNDAGKLGLFRLDEHLRRLLNSARICRLKMSFDEKDLRNAVMDLLRINNFGDDAYIRPWVFTKGVVREHITASWLDTIVIIDSWDAKSNLDNPRACKACVASWCKPGGNSLPPMVKAFSNYHNGRLASLEAWENGFDWPILLNQHKLVSEGPGACIALVKGQQLITPDLGSGILDSITRDTILKLACTELGMSVVERPVERTELYTSDEVFFMGTGWEILPIGEIDHLSVGGGDVGPLTAKIINLYSNIVRGRPESNWITLVQ